MKCQLIRQVFKAALHYRVSLTFSYHVFLAKLGIHIFPLLLTFEVVFSSSAIFSLLHGLFGAESHIRGPFFRVSAAHLLADVVIQVAFFAQFTTNVEVTLLLPGFHDADTVLAIGEAVHARGLLQNRTDLESFCNFLSAGVSIAHSNILLFLLLHCTESPIVFAAHFVGNTELALANLLDHVEVFAELVTLTHLKWDQHL